MVSYTNFRIYTSEQARHEGKPVPQAVVHYLHHLKIAARCAVFRGNGGLYETGEIAAETAGLSHNAPLFVDVLVPVAEAGRVKAELGRFVHDGFLAETPYPFVSEGAERRLISPRLLVRDLMSSPAVVARSGSSVKDAVQLMLDEKLKALPVVGDGGVLEGLVTTNDLLNAGMPIRSGLFSELPESQQQAFLAKASKIPVTQIMTSQPVSVRETAAVARAAHLLAAHRHKRLPVVDAQGRVVGVLARIDIFRAVSRELPEGHGEHQHASVQTVRDVTRPGALPVPENSDLMTAVDILVRQGEERTAVVDELGQVVGTIGDRELFGELDRGMFATGWRRLFVHSSKKVSSVMTRDHHTIDIDAPVWDALDVMVEHGVKRLPVVEQGRFAGMVRRDALLVALSGRL